jgi:predicted DNA-binding transcriptional regulator YafY
MASYSILRRYSLILDKLDNSHFPTKQQLVEFMHGHGFEIGERTLSRDLERLREDFAVEIEYDTYKRGYFINEAKSINLESFIRFLELSSTANVLAESLRDSREAIDYISFASEGKLQGISHLQSLLKAVQQNREIRFIYQRFDREDEYQVRMQPLLLKEYQYRWYVTGHVLPDQQVRIFGLDRMSELEVTDRVFDASRREEIRELFDSVVGLNYSDHDLTEITLAVTGHQWPYLKTLPLHESQEVVSEEKGRVVLKVKLRPNFEFKQRILMLGKHAEVLEPTWFRNEVAETLREALGRYG